MFFVQRHGSLHHLSRIVLELISKSVNLRFQPIHGQFVLVYFVGRGKENRQEEQTGDHREDDDCKCRGKSKRRAERGNALENKRGPELPKFQDGSLFFRWVLF